MKYVDVAVAVPLRRTFCYALPEQPRGQVLPGCRVRVPFGRRKLVGFVVRELSKEEADRVAGRHEIKTVQRVLDKTPLLSPGLVKVGLDIARHYCCSPGEVFSAMLPAGVKAGSKAARIAWVRPTAPPEKLKEEAERKRSRAKRQAALLDELASSPEPQPVASLLARTRASRAALSRLQKQGLAEIALRLAEEPPRYARENPPEPPALTAPQQHALDCILKSLAAGSPDVHLLRGVTGSGKTEVYLRAIQHAVADGGGAIVLVPEISLTPQTAARFQERFARVEILHSMQAAGARADVWQKARSGEVDVVVGPRSAVFAPVRNLRVIVVDEEHENSFKQDTSPRYHARDVAVMRARAENAVVILGSATPSLESFGAARRGEYIESILPERIGGRPMPVVRSINMAQERAERPSFRTISRLLEEQIARRLDRGEGVLLFLNRRGFNTFVRCARCNEDVVCESCGVPMVYHRQVRKLVCHHCGAESDPPTTCPSCGFGKLLYLGVGTERIERDIGALFPAARIARMDSDTMTNRHAYARVLDDFAGGRTQILIGTQMIAKGLDFPVVTLVGIVNADVATDMADFRATERTFQLVTQVAGRAGRGDKPGLVLVQTYRPESSWIDSACRHDYVSFAGEELEHRRERGFPPFARIARIVVASEKREHAGAEARSIADSLRLSAGESGSAVVVGPARAPIERVKNRYRFHMLVKAKDEDTLIEVLARCKRLEKRKSGVKVVVDVDPVSML